MIGTVTVDCQKEGETDDKQGFGSETQERINQVLRSIPGGKKKWIRYDEGAILYSMGIHAFMDLAKEAKAIYRIRRIVLVNTEKLDKTHNKCYNLSTQKDYLPVLSNIEQGDKQ